MSENEDGPSAVMPDESGNLPDIDAEDREDLASETSEHAVMNPTEEEMAAGEAMGESIDVDNDWDNGVDEIPELPELPNLSFDALDDVEYEEGDDDE